MSAGASASPGDTNPARFDPRDVVWSGRPAGLTLHDLKAAASAFGATFVVFAPGLRLAVGVEPLERAALLGAALSGAVAAVTALARVAGAGLPLALTASFLAPAALAAALFAPGAWGCPGTLAGAALALVLMRLRQRLATRYQVTATRGSMGEDGRYVLTFPIGRPPEVTPDRFGAGLGDVEFGEAPAALVTSDGNVFTIEARAHRFLRVRRPEDVLAALAGREPRRRGE